MLGLDALAGGGALGMLPGANLFSIVTKGLELIKNLIEQGDTKGADAVLNFMNQMLEESASSDTSRAAAEPQPFTPPRSQAAGAPLNLEVSFARPAGQPVSHGGLPTVDGSAQGDRMITEAARGLVEGSDAAKDRALTPGSNEWTTVMWAMQQNPNVQYNADTQRFFVQHADGSKLDVCSLQDAQNVVENNGGYNRSNPTAAGALGDFLKDKVDGAYQQPMSATVTLNITYATRPPDASSETVGVEALNAKIDELKRKLADIEAAQQVMSPAANIIMTVGR